MIANKHKIVALIGILVLSITTYFYLFKFFETLFWFYDLDPQLIYRSIDGTDIDYYKAHGRILPAKKPYFFIQLAQVIIIFIYCYIYSRPKAIGGIIISSENYSKITRGQEVKPITRAMLYIAGVFLILYIVIFLLGSIAPYGMLG